MLICGLTRSLAVLRAVRAFGGFYELPTDDEFE
jgi:hypothetical protein